MPSLPAAPLSPLNPQDVYRLSPAGAAELRGVSSSLDHVEIELLVRMDGVTSVETLLEDMPQVEQAKLLATIDRLRNRRLIEPPAPDPMGQRLQAGLARMQGGSASSEADAQMRALRADGFFVGIARRRQGRRRPGDGQALTAVVVEDEPALARFIRSYLALEGITARLAANRAEIVTELGKLPLADIILLDVNLPDADGFGILRKLRSHAVFKGTPVIMLTGSASREAVLQGMAAGADGYMTKPFEADALIQAVRTVLDLEAAEPPALKCDPWVNRDARVAPAVLRAAGP